MYLFKESNRSEIEALTLRLAEATTLLHARDEQLALLREDSARLTATLESERRSHEAELQAASQRQEQALQTERSRADASAEVDAIYRDHAKVLGVIRATVDRVVYLGFEVRVEMTSATNGASFIAQITRGDAEALGLKDGDTV